MANRGAAGGGSLCQTSLAIMGDGATRSVPVCPSCPMASLSGPIWGTVGAVALSCSGQGNHQLGYLIPQLCSALYSFSAHDWPSPYLVTGFFIFNGSTVWDAHKTWRLCFVFQGQYYQQMEGAAMGSPLSPIVANIFMEHFEKEALEIAPHPPSLWKRFVDDTFVILESQHKDEFFHHINSLDCNIKFTAETTKADGSIPCLDTLITPQRDGSLQTKVYRKPTHTNQYLQWDSHHAMSNKYSAISSLLHRAKDICSNKQLLEEEQKQIQEALQTCKYPAWAINRMKIKISTPRNKNNNNQDNRPTYKNFVTVPYNEGLSETFKNVCKRYGIQVHFKSGKTIKDELVAPKDQDHITKKSGIIYRYKCDRLEFNEEYIGETARTFGERFKEHLKAPSPIFDHSNISGHSTTINNFTVVGREEQNLSRLIKESMFIRVNNPSLNKNIGKYHLPHIWDEVLVNNTELKLK